ncbi:MAG: OB-fold nucleic acid binding domain-containing protein [Candidatus Nanoarchaeia archaeon]
MRDRTFVIIALIWSLVGLFLLLLIANFAQPPQLKISELEGKIGKVVQLSPVVVESISYKSDVVFLKLNDSTGTILGVYFDEPPFDLVAKDIVSVKGKVQMYKGELEIVIGELKCLSCQ